jgi:hypothetical protein
MKHIFLGLCAVIGTLASHAQCANGDLESGGLGLWTAYVNTTLATGIINPLGYTMVASSPRHNVTSILTPDPVVGSAIMGAANGNFAAKLGDAITGSQSEILSYTFTLTPDFAFKFAMVLNNGHPDPADNAFFSYWISLSSSLPSSTTGGNLLALEEFRPDPTNPFYIVNPSGSVLYRPWVKECVLDKFPSLSAYVGSVVTIYFATSDCPYSGHYGYAYIDDLCSFMPPVPSFTAPASIGSIPPASHPLIVDGTASINVQDHYYKVEECNSAGVVIPGGAVDSTSLILGSPGIIDIRSMLPPGFFTFTTFYKITLHAVDCSTTYTFSRLLYVN